MSAAEAGRCCKSGFGRRSTSRKPSGLSTSYRELELNSFGRFKGGGMEGAFLGGTVGLGCQRGMTAHEHGRRHPCFIGVPGRGLGNVAAVLACWTENCKTNSRNTRKMRALAFIGRGETAYRAAGFVRSSSQILSRRSRCFIIQRPR
jgi:hypothetical protein